MVTKQLTFHMPEEANPRVMLAILEAWSSAQDMVFSSSKDVLSMALAERDIPNRSEPLSFALRLGLIDRVDGGLGMSGRARALLGQRDPVRHDILHYLAYTGWFSGTEDEMTPFWSYRNTCDALWEMAPVSIREQQSEFIERIIATSQGEFAEHPAFTGPPSYGRKSLRGILRWLELLSPPVVSGGGQEQVFQRRSACSSELLVLSAGYCYQVAGTEPGVELLLSPRNRDIICRLCLVEPAYLDRLLDWAFARHGSFVAQAERSGMYGRYIRLRRIPTAEEILSAN